MGKLGISFDKFMKFYVAIVVDWIAGQLFRIVWTIEQFLSFQWWRTIHQQWSTAWLTVAIVETANSREEKETTKKKNQSNRLKKFNGRICTYIKLVRENSIIRLRRELPCELWWFNGVEFTINELCDFSIVRLLGDSSKSICEWSKRRNDSSDVGWMARLGTVGVDVTAIFCGWFDVLRRFNLNTDNIDRNKFTI